MCNLDKKCGPCSLKENKKVLKENANNYWIHLPSSFQMYRPKGKTWPAILYSKESNKIFARDNNGPRPSQSLETNNISLEGIKSLLKGISLPHPSDEMLMTFLNTIKTSSKTIKEAKVIDITGYVEKKGRQPYIDLDDEWNEKKCKPGQKVSFTVKGKTFKGVVDIEPDDEIESGTYYKIYLSEAKLVKEDVASVGPRINTSREPILRGFEVVFPRTEPETAATRVYDIVQSLGTDENFKPNWSNKIILKNSAGSVILKANFDYSSYYQTDKNWKSYGNIFIDTTLPNIKSIVQQIKSSSNGLNEAAKGDRVIVGAKHLPGTYVGPTNKNNKHIIKLDNGSFVEITPQQWMTGDSYDSIKKKNRQAGAKQAAETRSYDLIDTWFGELKMAERELRDLFRDQENEVGGLEGGTDEFESTGRHDVYGSEMNELQRKIENLKKKLRKHNALSESVIKEDSMTPPVEMQRKENVKYKDPYFVNLVWEVVRSLPNISSSELWERFLHNGLADEYMGDTRTFYALMKFMLEKGYIKKGETPKPPSRTAWVVGTKPVYTVNAQTNTGKIKESKSLTESILRENEMDIEKYAEVIEYFDNGLGMLRGIKTNDLSSTGLMAVTSLAKAIQKFKNSMRDNTEMRDN